MGKFGSTRPSASDVTAPAQSQKPGQAGRQKAKPGRAFHPASDGFWPGFLYNKFGTFSTFFFVNFLLFFARFRCRTTFELSLKLN